MARDLDRLLAVKDDAHYGTLHVSAQRANAALRQAAASSQRPRTP